MTASIAEKVRSKFRAIAARIKRERNGLPPGAVLPVAVKGINGHPTSVKIYEVPQELDFLEV